MADAIASAIINITLKLTRKAVLDSMDSEIPSKWSNMMKLLQDDFDKVNAQLDQLMVKDLKFAQSQIVHGLNAIKSEETNEVTKQFFISAEENARRAFFTTDMLLLKAEAAKVRVYALMHIHGYFRQDTPRIALFKL